MHFNQFDKNNLNILRKELQAVLDKYESNVEIEVDRMSYTSTEVKITLNAKIEGATTRSDSLLNMYAEMHDLVLEKNGRRLVEYQQRKYKMPFIYIDTDGKRYKTDLNGAKLRFGKN